MKVALANGAVFDAAAAFQRIVAQCELGPRFAGSVGHRQAHALLTQWLAAADEAGQQCFEESFFGKRVLCRNIWGRLHGEQPGLWILGTHFDTRVWADEDPNPDNRLLPVPGANDGASGVALLAELLLLLKADRRRPSIEVVFFDAEDWGGIDGKDVSIGARHYVKNLASGSPVDWMLDIDMVAGSNLMLDVDVSCQSHDGSFVRTLEFFQTGHSMGLSAFSMAKPKPYKWIACDHLPFMEAGIAATLVMDLDYPQWHSTADTPEACDAGSLAQIAQVLARLLYGLDGER